VTIRFGNLGVEGIPDIEGSPEDDIDGVISILVDAPAGRGLFHGPTKTAIEPLEKYRTLKRYHVRPTGKSDAKSSCGGDTWVYFVRYRSKFGGKWESLSAMISIHACSSGASFLEVETDDGSILEWNLSKAHTGQSPKHQVKPNLDLN
jgi:hypothetical protein